jgi:ribonuclease R
LSAFVRAAGHRIPRDLTRRDLQQLLDAVKGTPASYAVNLAVLKTFQQAEYSPMHIGHFALASSHYCHFTSPIRRYPDLMVHRVLADHCRGRLKQRPPEDTAELARVGEALTAAERRSEAAEGELREVLLLQMLAGRIGEEFDGVVTGVANFGIFVQLRRFLTDGLVRLEDLGDDWWDVDARGGLVRGERSGRTYRIGDVMRVRVVNVDEPRRQLNLVPAKAPAQAAAPTRGAEAAKAPAPDKGVPAKGRGKHPHRHAAPSRRGRRRR